MYDDKYDEKDSNQPQFPWWMRGGGRGRQVARGDVSCIILAVLHEQPMHGYQIIRHLEERSHGFWRPSAGSIYPTLQMLEEQGLIIAQEENGKKVYTLTVEGVNELKKNQEKLRGPWKHFFQQHKNDDRRKLWQAMHQFMHALRQLGHEASPEKVSKAEAIILAAAKELETLSK